MTSSELQMPGGSRAGIATSCHPRKKSSAQGMEESLAGWLPSLLHARSQRSHRLLLVPPEQWLVAWPCCPRQWQRAVQTPTPVSKIDSPSSSISCRSPFYLATSSAALRTNVLDRLKFSESNCGVWLTCSAQSGSSAPVSSIANSTSVSTVVPKRNWTSSGGAWKGTPEAEPTIV